MIRPGNLPLRWRLTLLYVGLLTLLLAALGGTLYLDTRQFLITSTALRMRAQAKPVVERFRSPAPRIEAIATDLSRALTSRDTTAVVLDASGAVLADGQRLPEEPAPASPDPARVAAALAGENELTYIGHVAGRRHLIVLIPLRLSPDATTISGVAQLNSPLDPTDAFLLHQRTLTGLGLLITIGIGTVGVFWLTGSAIAPLRTMVATCRRIAAGDFSQRVGYARRRDEVGQLAAAFDEMADRIEATFAAQRRFSAAAAHELRTPLTALRGSLEVLLRGSQDDPAAVNRLAQGMHREVTRLGRLTEQLLDLHRLDAPLAPRPQPLALGPFLAAFVALAQPLAAGRALQIDRGHDATLNADPDLLQQALYNLVDNAVQHTSDSGTIRVGWRDETSGTREQIALFVADDGAGIAEVDLPHLFEPFYRGEWSRSRRRGGSGLGLAIVRAIAESHGGTITADCTLGAGATFTLTFPNGPREG